MKKPTQHILFTSLACVALFARMPVALADVPSVHGMLLFGQDSTYASHLPMFHSPHDYQLLLKLNLKSPAHSTGLAAYQKAKAAGESFFTLVPEVMDLTHVISGDKSEFSADIYLGHFEQGGTNLGAVQVKVEKILYTTKLNAQSPPTQFIQHLVFGNQGEYYSLHLVQEKPSFDAVASVSQPYFLKFAHCRTRVCDEPKKVLVADHKLPLVLKQYKFGSESPVPTPGTQIGDLSTALSDVQKILYLEKAELSH